MAIEREKTEQFIALLQVNGMMRREDICELLGISDTRLSEYLTELKKHGIPNVAPKRKGLVKLQFPDESSPSVFEKSVEEVNLKKMTTQDIRYWIILFTLRKGPQTIDSIADQFALITDGMNFAEAEEENALSPEGAEKIHLIASKDTIRDDLKILEKYGFVKKQDKKPIKPYIYEHTLKSSILCDFRPGELAAFRSFQSMLSQDMTSSQEVADVFEKVSVLSKPGKPIAEDTLSYFGKQNIISAAAKKNLFQLTQLPYQEKMIQIKYPNRNGDVLEYKISCGLIFHSVETGQLYILCKTAPPAAQKKNDFDLFNMERILSMKVLSKTNEAFHRDDIMQAYNEMLGANVYDRMHIKIRFDNKPYLLNNIQILQENRTATASITLDESTDTFLYEDTIRGRADLRRYLRFFGPEYVIESPPELAEEMMDSARRIVEMYKGRFENE